MTTVRSPSHDFFSHTVGACTIGESCGSSSGFVCIQPRSSMPLKYSCSGNMAGPIA